MKSVSFTSEVCLIVLYLVLCYFITIVEDKSDEPKTLFSCIKEKCGGDIRENIFTLAHSSFKFCFHLWRHATLDTKLMTQIPQYIICCVRFGNIIINTVGYTLIY